MVETTQNVIETPAFNKGFVGTKLKALGRIVGFGRDYQGRREIYLYIRRPYQERPMHVAFIYQPGLLGQDIGQGDFVEVEGHMIAFFRRNDVNVAYRQPTYVQLFVADKITKAKTEIEEVFGVEGGFAHQPGYFRAYYEGEVTRVDHNDGTVRSQDGKRQSVTYNRVLVRTIPNEYNNNRSNIVSAQYTSRMRVADVNPQRGDKVIVVANVSTNRKRVGTNNERVYFTNLFIDDMVVIKRAEQNSTAETSTTETSTPEEVPTPQTSAPATEEASTVAETTPLSETEQKEEVTPQNETDEKAESENNPSDNATASEEVEDITMTTEDDDDDDEASQLIGR